MRHPLTGSVAIVRLVAAALLLAACSGGGGTPGPGGAACLEGEWTTDVAGQQAALREQTAGPDGVLTIDLSGGVVTSFSAGTITTAFEDQLLVITATSGGRTLRNVTTLDGSSTGTYTATDTDVTIAIADASGLTITMGNYEGDVLVEDQMAGFDDIMRQAIETTTTAAYTCSGDTLTITVPEGNTDLGLGSAVETVMHRR